MRAVRNTAYKFGSLFGEFEYLKTMHPMQNPLFASNHPSFHLNKSSFGNRAAAAGTNGTHLPILLLDIKAVQVLETVGESLVRSL